MNEQQFLLVCFSSMSFVLFFLIPFSNFWFHNRSHSNSSPPCLLLFLFLQFSFYPSPFFPRMLLLLSSYTFNILLSSSFSSLHSPLFIHLLSFLSLFPFSFFSSSVIFSFFVFYFLFCFPLSSTFTFSFVFSTSLLSLALSSSLLYHLPYVSFLHILLFHFTLVLTSTIVLSGSER